MKSLNIKLSAAIVTIAALSAGTASAAGVQTLHSGDVETMHLWHGNGAGLEGADRIALIGKRKAQAKPITVTYDEATVARTNMRRAEAGTSIVTVNADRRQDRDERTNAPVFAATKKPVQAAGIGAPKAN
jgi:ABC-type glycerol-3-phosphate transport system substrate-binding protein